MAISTDYATPVNVNGYSCKNCTDVDRAKKFIDPANPAGGPFGVNDPAGTSARGHVSIFRPDALATADTRATSAATYGRSGRSGGAAIGSHVDLMA